MESYPDLREIRHPDDVELPCAGREFHLPHRHDEVIVRDQGSLQIFLQKGLQTLRDDALSDRVYQERF